MKLKGLLIIALFFIIGATRSQIPLSSPVFLLPTGEEKSGLPVFKLMNSTDANYRKARKLFDRGFANHVVTLYKLAQQYQITHGKLSNIEEAYLAFTSNKGGFARTGFWLQTPDGLIDKHNVGFVDLNVSSLEYERDEVAAPPQIFSHEMGHLILKVLTLTPDDQRKSRTPLMHYFTTVTDYVTAFDEGFAEHLQYLTVEFENNKKVKDTITNRLRVLKLSLPRTMYGYERDYNLPLRMGFFTATMPLWYQKVENVRRYTFIRNNWAKMPARVAKNISNPKDYIHYRNASVWPTPAATRTYEQDMSVEGVLAGFFSHCVINDMNRNYLQEEFYREFLPDTSVKVPQQIDIHTNQYLKMFSVIANFVTLAETPGGPLTNFIEGYLKFFPQETTYIKSCWLAASGHEFKVDPASELWVMNHDFDFLPYAMAPYGPTQTSYPFNLNAADTFDLMSFDGVTRSDAETIMAWRQQNNGFKNLAEVESIKGIAPEKLRNIANSPYDDKTAESNYNRSRSFSSFLVFPLLHLLKMMLIWFIILGTTYALALHFWGGLIPTTKRLMFLFLKILLFTTAGLVVQLVGIKQFAIMMAFTVFVALINYLMNRRKGKLLWISLATTFAVGVVMLYSLY